VKSGWIQGTRREYKNRLLTVATVQTLYSQIDDIDFWDNWGMVICDEGHRFPSLTFTSVIGELPAKYRLGVSATFRRADRLDKVWEWHLGPKFFKSESKGLSGKYRQIFDKLPINDKQFLLRNGNINHSAFATAITQFDERNKAIAKGVDNLAASGRKILVLSDRIDHLETLKKLIKTESGYYVGMVKGKKIDKDELCKSVKKQVILGTPGKISEGTDIPELDTLVLATMKGDIEQVVGRITRDFPDKFEPLVVDYVVSTGYNIALSKKREKVLQKLRFTKV